MSLFVRGYEGRVWESIFYLSLNYPSRSRCKYAVSSFTGETNTHMSCYFVHSCHVTLKVPCIRPTEVDVISLASALGSVQEQKEAVIYAND